MWRLRTAGYKKCTCPVMWGGGAFSRGVTMCCLPFAVLARMHVQHSSSAASHTYM